MRCGEVELPEYVTLRKESMSHPKYAPHPDTPNEPSLASYELRAENDTPHVEIFTILKIEFEDKT